MIKKIKNIFYLISYIIFITFIIVFYFSDENIRSINKSRSLSYENLNKKIKNLPLLKNDTVNIIEYTKDSEVQKKKKKYYKFFDLIKNN